MRIRRWWLMLGALSLWGCTLPRIIVLNDPLDARQHNDLGVAYEQRGELDLAKREYRRAAELDEQWSRPLVNLGNIAARQSNWRTASELYRDALTLRPDDAEVMNNLAWVLTQDRRPTEALSWAQQSVAIAAADPRCWDTLAEVYLALDRAVDAREAAEQGLALNPTPALKASLQNKLLSD